MSVRFRLAYTAFFGACTLSCAPVTAATPAPACAHWQQTASTQMRMNSCSAADAQRSGRDVVNIYLAYRETLAGGRRKALDATQRAWATYRAAYCAEKGAAVSGGSMQPLVISSCVDTLNRRRAADLAKDRTNS